MIAQTYNFWLVLLSFLVTMAGCHAGLSLASQLNEQGSRQTRLVIFCIALILGSTTWAAHFIGMLALDFPFVVSYDLQLTLISSLSSILIIGVGLYFVTTGEAPKLIDTVIAGTVLGLGFSLMHFLGIEAFQSIYCVVAYDISWMLASAALSVIVSILALQLVFQHAHRQHVFLGAAMLACSVCGMHYFSMFSSEFISTDVMLDAEAPAVSRAQLAVCVSLVVFGVVGTVLLMLFPNVRPERSADGPVPRLRETVAESAEVSDDALPLAVTISVERNGRLYFLSANQIVYAQAESHYSHLYDGKELVFCKLSLSELEDQLPSSTFIRTHRSFIVNIRHVTGMEKDRNHGRLFFDCDDNQSIPVSRRRMRDIQDLLSRELSGPATSSPPFSTISMKNE